MDGFRLSDGTKRLLWGQEGNRDEASAVVRPVERGRNVRAFTRVAV